MDHVKIVAWHGTNQAFDFFDMDLLGSAHPNTASDVGFFFSGRAETAIEYAHSCARKMVPGQLDHEERIQQILLQAGEASARGDYDASEKLYEKAEQIESDAIQAAPSEARILRCEIDFKNPAIVDGTSREVMFDLGKVLREARDMGHDGVILENIVDTPSGGGDPDDHIVVFYASSIQIMDEHFVIDEPQEEQDVCDIEFDPAF